MKNTSKVIAVLLALLIVLIIDLAINIYHFANYNSQKQAGNARWGEVEQRIITIEQRMDRIEQK